MACSAQQIIIQAGKAVVDAAKAEYDNALTDLKTLVPGDFPTRQDFEDAKDGLIVGAKDKLAAYKAEVETLKTLATGILPLDLLKVEAIDLAEEGTNAAMAAGLTSPGATAAALAKSVIDKGLKDSLLC